jgi:hypothetical protein
MNLLYVWLNVVPIKSLPDGPLKKVLCWSDPLIQGQPAEKLTLLGGACLQDIGDADAGFALCV